MIRHASDQVVGIRLPRSERSKTDVEEAGHFI